jgi:hypothetical protein
MDHTLDAARMDRSQARWIGVVVDKIEPQFVTNGGPVIMLQVENEYGPDDDYLNWAVNMAVCEELPKRSATPFLTHFITLFANAFQISCSRVPTYMRTRSKLVAYAFQLTRVRVPN